MVENIIQLLNDPKFSLAIKISKYFIVTLTESFAEDREKVLKKRIADSELRTAKNVLDSLPFEDEYNWENGLNRVITHLESAFDLYVENGEFESACICGLYLSCMHKAIGNKQDELYKKIWLRIPLKSQSAVTFDKYELYVKMFISDSVYQDIVTKRKKERLDIIDNILESMSKSFISYCPKPQVQFVLKYQKELLEQEKRELLNEKDQRSDFKKIWDLVKPW